MKYCKNCDNHISINQAIVGKGLCEECIKIRRNDSMIDHWKEDQYEKNSLKKGVDSN